MRNTPEKTLGHRIVRRRAPAKASLIALFAILVVFLSPVGLAAQESASDDEATESPINIAVPELEDETILATEREQLDDLIAQRLAAIYAELDGLEKVTVVSQSGVVTLAGEVANSENASEAVALAERVDGVILVRDSIDRLRDIEGNLSPAVEGLSDNVDAAIGSLPLLAVAFVIFLAIALIGHLFARWKSLWRTILPNVFLAELVSQAVRVIAFVLGLVVALNLLGANTLMGTILGGAGVIGIAIGFAVRDTLENYVSSIMLSLRQPFRSRDHVVIGEHEGVVVRLTSRATILMTMDGNHLRIPNADVYKGVILNYSRNPERRFDFTLGVDAEDDPASGMETGVEALKQLPFLLESRPPFGAIEEVGDSSIILRFYAWIDQTEADFLKARSLSIRAAKDALEADGFTLPEPIYRLRFDQSKVLGQIAETDAEEEPEPSAKPRKPKRDRKTPSAGDVAPDECLAQTIEQERAQNQEDDLLDGSRPVE
ncbi:MAG: mechanosensitive ion channel family protein [Pseudomonadota bacterium]